MRPVFACQECGTHYLPPEGMEYGDGTKASPVWCAECQILMRKRGIEESPIAAAVAMLAAKAALHAQAAAGEEPRPDVRPSRPVRTGRGRIRPTGARSKLA